MNFLNLYSSENPLNYSKKEKNSLQSICKTSHFTEILHLLRFPGYVTLAMSFAAIRLQDSWYGYINGCRLLSI